MATETVASNHHTSITDEKAKEEAIGEKDEDAHGLATPSYKTEGEAEGDEKKGESNVVEVEISDDSAALEASGEDDVKHDKVEDSQGPAAPISNTQTEAEPEEKKGEAPADVVEKTDDSASSEPFVAENLKEEKELVPDSKTVGVTEPASDLAKSTEPTESIETEEEKQPDAAHIPEAIEEKTREPEFDAEVSKETNNYEAGPEEAEKTEHVVTEIEVNPSVPEKQSTEKEEKAHQTEAEIAAVKPGDIVKVHPSQELDIEVAKETGNSNSEAEPVKAEEQQEPELVSIEVKGKSREQLEEAEEVGKTSKNVEAERELVRGAAKSKGTSDDTIKEPIVEKVAANVEEQNKAPDAVEGSSSREAEVEIKKVEEQNGAKTTTTEEHAETKSGEVVTGVSEHVRETLASKFQEKEAESVKTGVDNDLKKDQIEDPANKTDVQIPESDATKTSSDLPKDTPAKPAQKHSNNLISKVKQSLVKAKKVITGKSPTSKTLSSGAKDDIKVK